MKKVADKVFSVWIRLRDSDEMGMCRCFTCGAVKHWTEMQCGHYISRSWMALRYDEKNCHAQCVACNIFKMGNMDEYALALIRRYGKNILKELNDLKKVSSMTRQILEGIIKRYEKAEAN